MKWLTRLRIYLSCEAGQHAGLLIGFMLFACVIYFASRHHDQQSAAARDATSWILVEAVVLSSRINEVDASSDNSFSTRLSVNAEFSYELKGMSTHGSYAGMWNRNDYRNWSDLLRPGNRIMVRVSPHDPAKVSLVDYNGIP